MTTKGATIHFRLTGTEQESIEGYMADQGGPSLSDAIRRLIALGLRAAQSHPKVDLKAILKEIDPAWSGRAPRLVKPLHIAHGSEALESLLREEQGL